jgi:hypothetical protein
MLHSQEFDVICVTETWLHDAISNSIILDGSAYSMFRTDRTVANGGGVCILANNRTTKVSPIPVPSRYSHLELCVVDLLSRCSRLRLFVFYRPPSCDSDHIAVDYMRELCACISELYPDNSTVILCGDLNLPNIDWSSENCSKSNNSTCSGVFLEFFYMRGLRQLVECPTRLDHILDVVFCNNHNCVLNTNVSEPFSTSDHCKVCFEVLYDAVSDSHTYSKRDFNCADWLSIKTYINTVDFFLLFHGNQPAYAVLDEFYRIINACIELYVPLKTMEISSKSCIIKYPVRIKRLIRKKATLWRIHRTFRTSVTLAAYKKIASECKSAIHLFMLTYERQLITSANIGYFYRYANRKLCSRSAVGPLASGSDETLLTDAIDKARTLQQTFSSNFVVDNGLLPAVSNIEHSPNKLDHIVFTPALVRLAIKKLKHKTKGGPDCIPPLFFKNCCDELCYPLSCFFTISFDSGYLPPVWLTSFITPIFKKGNPVDANNYRPIALTATMCKLMESIIKDQMVRFMVDEGFITKCQHAFIKQHSTASNLLECIRDWTVAFTSGQQTDIVYVDFAKAFDSIVPSKLLLKLELYGISGRLHKWLSGFLNNRTQRVVVDYRFSDVCDVVSGVPQGSVLGPLLFLIYINDIDTVCRGNIELKLFADDAKLYTAVKVASDSLALQQSLDRLACWASEWQLSMNVNKCAVLSLSCSSQPTLYTYFLNDLVISRQNSYVDLGITINSNLSFEQHINNIVSKAQQRTCCLLRGFLTRNSKTMRLAFITYIRPLLEYNSIVWNPDFICLIDLIEKVQRNFTKRIPSIASLSYPERLAILDLELLELRRLRFDLIYYFKILNHLTPFNPSEVFTIYTPAARSRTIMPYLQKPIHASNRQLSTFFLRNVNAWNALPASLRSCSSLPTFKLRLKQLDLSAFLKGSASH